MKMTNNMDFVLLLQNESFLKRIEETFNSENQIEILEKEFSADREEIIHAIAFVKINLSEQKRMPYREASEIMQTILIQTTKKSRFYKELWKVAALIIILLSISFFLYRSLPVDDQLEKIAASETNIGSEAMIILSDGSKHKLGVNDSKIEYKSDGGEVFIKKDKQVEKIENPTSSATTINQVIVPFGRRHVITLSDGTQVQLNSGSRLVFPAQFTGSKRTVYLKGEGYFEVAKNPDKPFIVETAFINVKVLGTVFNLSAYEDEKTTSTVLLEGKVMISEKNDNQGYTEKKLVPGQGCFYNSTTFTSEIREVQTDEFTSWKDGVLLLKNKPLGEVIKRVEKYYNKRILVNGENLDKTLINGKLVLSGEIDEVVDYLAKTMEAKKIKNADESFSIIP
jgi:ferric-dicitrate binding protein FerR (iron transport regulator)